VFAEGGVQLTIRGPERIALTGANGAGKSTLLRILNGEVEPDGGVIKRAEGRVPVGVLSGGERLRATLACVLFAEPAPQLLLLDEPTNNLDLVSVGQLENALNAYEGAFVVVSHDERFLAEIKVERWLGLRAGRLRESGPL
jgi:ATPase subunit of ABC transporter with duplicated ATPase domains